MRGDLDVSSCMSWSSQPFILLLSFVDKNSYAVNGLYQFVPLSRNNHIKLFKHYEENFATVLIPFSEFEKLEELGEGVW